jgi:hypothetical protein
LVDLHQIKPCISPLLAAKTYSSSDHTARTTNELHILQIATQWRTQVKRLEIHVQVSRSHISWPLYLVCQDFSGNDPETDQRHQNLISSLERSSLCTPLRKELHSPVGLAQIDDRRSKHEAEIPPRVSHLPFLEIDYKRGSRIAATKRARNAKYCAQQRLKKRLLKAGQERANNSLAIQSVIDSPAQTYNL